jgi:hypothetical protein
MMDYLLDGKKNGKEEEYAKSSKRMHQDYLLDGEKSIGRPVIERTTKTQLSVLSSPPLAKVQSHKSRANRTRLVTVSLYL